MAVAFVRSHTVTTEKVLDNSTALAISTATTPGNVLVAYILFDNAAGAASPTVSTLATAAGETNTWTLLGQALYPNAATAGGFANGAMYAIRTSVVWPVASYAVTLSAAVTMKATMAQEFSGALATTRSTPGSAYSTTTTAATAFTNGAPQIPGQTGDVALGFIFGSNAAAAQAGSTETTGGTWSTPVGVGSTGGSAATNNFGVAQYKILTSNAYLPVANSAAMTAGNGAIAIVLQQYVDPAITQAGYQFYADGTESASTALAAQDTTPTVDTSAGDVNAQLRVRLQSTTSAAVDPWDDFQLQWERNASGTWNNVVTPTGLALADNNPSTNWFLDQSYGTGQTNYVYLGQQFRGNGLALKRMGFRLVKTAASGGTITASLWSATGALGAGSPATLVATTTTPMPGTGVTTTSNSAWTYFDFDGTVLLTDATYWAVITTDNTGIQDRAGNSGNTHPGAYSGRNSGGTWFTMGTTSDLLFEVYTTGSTCFAYASPNLTDAAATTNRLTGGSGTFTAGKVSEDGLADDVGFSGNNHTELLYSLTFKAADLTAGDTIRFRVLRNGSTSGFTYTQVPTVTIGGGGGGGTAYPLAGTVAATSATSGTIGAVLAPRSFSDDFNRADAGDLGSLNWGSSYDLYSIASNRCAPEGSSSSPPDVEWRTPTATSDNYSQITVTTASSSVSSGVVCRATDPYTVVNYYLWRANGGTLTLFKVVGGSFTNITADLPYTLVAGDVLKISAVGSTITGYVNGVAMSTVTDTAITTGLYVGMRAGTGCVVDDWLGGDGTGPATAWPLAGTVAATSATTGAAQSKLTLTGTVAGSSAASGNPAAAHPLTSTVAATSATTGTPASVHPLTGTLAGTGATAGAPVAAHPLAGAVDAVSATSGTISTVAGAQDYPLSGTVAATSAVTGSVTAGLALAGTVAGTGATTGAPTASHPLTGTTPATSTTTGSIATAGGLAGTVAGTSASSGAPAAVHPLAGTVAGTSTTTGTINVVGGAQDYPLDGTLPATTATSGTMVAVHPLAGVAAGTSTSAGDIAAAHPLAGTVAGATATSGTIGTVVGAQSYPLAGTLTATSATAGDPRSVHPLAGINPATSTTIGDPALRTPMAGTVAAVTTTAGKFAPEGLSGTAAGTSATIGTIRGLYSVAGTATATSGTTGAVRGLYRLAGTAPATSATVGALRARYPVAGTVTATSATYGRITPRGYHIPRPKDGTTPRPDAGISARPDTGRTIRPDTGTTARADAGTTTRPRELEHA